MESALEIERVEALERDNEKLRAESACAMEEASSALQRAKMQDAEREELSIEQRSLEGQIQVLRRQLEFFKGPTAVREGESQPVNVQIRKLLGVINRARRLNEGRRLVTQSLLTTRPPLEEKASIEPPTHKKTN